MNEQLDFLSIVDILLRKWSIILISAILVGVCTFVYSEVFVTPVYSSNATLYVNSSKKNTNNEVSTQSLSSSRELVMTYAEILQSRNFLTKVSEDMDSVYSPTEIKGMISMEPVNETEILAITVKGTNADDVIKITQSIVKHAPDELERVIEAGSVKTLDNPSESRTPISPNIRRNTFIGVLAGIVIGALIAIVLELFDTRIKNGEEISSKYKEPVLGEIPSLMSKSSSQNYPYGGYGYGNSSSRRSKK